MGQLSIAKKVLRGGMVGIIATVLGTVLWILGLSDTDLVSTLKNAYHQKQLGIIMSAGALLNIGTFFLFMKQRKIYEARGVIITVLLVAIFGMIQKFG